MGVAMEARAGQEQPDGRAKHIVFFDVETNVPGRAFASYELLEFGAVVLDARSLAELRSFHTLIRPTDLSCIDRRTTECNTIVVSTVADAPIFQDVADDIYQLLHGNIWAGHNILKFDILRLNEAFSKIGRPSPQPSGIVDTYPLLRRTFGKRAGNYKLATLANYCGFGKQEHRSIADVRMNIDVLRSCATMLFLESNYPDIFMAQMELSATTSVLRQLTSISNFSPHDSSFVDKNKEQEADSQIQLDDQAGEPSAAFQTTVQSRVQSRGGISSQMGASSKGLEEIDSGLSSSFLDLKLSISKNVRKDGCNASEGQAHSSCSRVVAEDEECVSSKLTGVSSISRVSCVQENALTAHENASAVEVMDVKSGKVEILMNSIDPLLQSDSTLNKSAIDNIEGNEINRNLLNALDCMSLQMDTGDLEVHGPNVAGVESSSTAQLSKQRSSIEFDGLPFLLASHVNLSSIDVCEEHSFHKSSRTLYYQGFPLHLLEFKVRVRFTINSSYACDDKGKPRFSILVEPSEAACNVIRKCEDVVKSAASSNSKAEWLPALKEEFGCWVTRMSIGTKQMGSHSIYTTKFFRSTSNGLEALSLGHVDASTFRTALPHGSIIDTGFGFYIFNVNNRTGVRILAKHITLS